VGLVCGSELCLFAVRLLTEQSRSTYGTPSRSCMTGVDLRNRQKLTASVCFLRTESYINQLQFNDMRDLTWFDAMKEKVQFILLAG
jgi:hypothetical protein